MMNGRFLPHVAAAALLVVANGPRAAAQVPHPRDVGTVSQYIDPAAGLTLSALIERGLQQEPALQAMRLDVTAARHAVRQAGLRANPGVTVERRQELGGMDRQLTAMVEWPLELFRRKARVSTANREVDVASAAAADRERTLADEIRRQYGRLLVAVHHLAVFEELLTASRETVALLDARAREGAAPRIDRDAAAVDAGRIQAQRVLAAGIAEAAVVELKRLVGLEPSAPLKLRETLHQVVHSGVVHTDAPAVEAVNERPDIRQAAAAVQVQAARTEQRRSEGRFELSLFGGYMRMDAGFAQQAFGPSGQLEPIRGVFHNAVVGANVTLPLFNRNQGAIAEASTRRAAAEKMLDARRLAAASEVAAATARVRAGHEALAVFGGALLGTARRNLDVMREAYQLGRYTLLDVLAEQRRYLELEMAHSDALAEAFDAQAALRAALAGIQE